MKRKTWTKKEWKEKRQKILSENPNCSLCGSNEKLVIHHPQKWKDQTQEEYESLDGTNVLCSRCHFALHHGMDLCPICKKKYKKNHYSTCFNCLPELAKTHLEYMREIEEEDQEDDRWCDEFYSSTPKRQQEMLKEQDKKCYQSFEFDNDDDA